MIYLSIHSAESFNKSTNCSICSSFVCLYYIQKKLFLFVFVFFIDISCFNKYLGISKTLPPINIYIVSFLYNLYFVRGASINPLSLRQSTPSKLLMIVTVDNNSLY